MLRETEPHAASSEEDRQQPGQTIEVQNQNGSKTSILELQQAPGISSKPENVHVNKT